MEDRIGMHNHRVGAKNSLSDFFSECLENNIKTVAITDHKTLKTYIEEFPKLTAEDRDKFRRIKIIIGLEMTGMYEYTNIAGQKHKIAMDILGYNLDLSKHDLLDKLVSQNYVFTDSPEFQRKELERLIAVAKTLGFEADYDNMHISKEEKLAARILSYGLIDPKYKDYNLSKGMLPELIINPRVFFNENFNVKLTTTINYDKENMEFSNADYQYQYLELKEVKTNNSAERSIIYKHYYPENETYYNMEKNNIVKIDNLKEMQEILKNIGCRILSKQVVKEMMTEVLDKYYMSLKEYDDTVYSIEIKTIDNHYITKVDYEELSSYLKKYNINHVENVF